MTTAVKTKVHNYSAGPCILPPEVFEQAAQAVLDFQGSGLSILEISHRSKPFVEVMEHARALVKELLGVPEGYRVLFLGGGASTGFYLTALNFLRKEGFAAYANTGTWATGAVKEAQSIGRVEVVASGEADDFTRIPKGFAI
ncbi:MAG: aminotransferase class V-fold PLP-dependent enzyme, partial [Flavobacteriales bacterium]|nr:aminotransferase class V-fold PLP-dependent enzyme [Flavobacteriales bacterium]